MSKKEKLFNSILSGKSDYNIPFDALRTILIDLGFTERNKGTSHFIYTKKGIVERINLQKDESGKAKGYQVKQVREMLIRNKLTNLNED